MNARLYCGWVTSPRLYVITSLISPSTLPYCFQPALSVFSFYNFSLFHFYGSSVTRRPILSPLLYAIVSKMAHALRSANFTITITVANHTSPVDVPLPKTTCYTVPYGWIGFINGLVTMYICMCLLVGRTPLFPWRPRRHQRLFFCLYWPWMLSVSTLYLINLGMCASSYVTLFWIILVKFFWSICVMAAVGNAVKIGLDKMAAKSLPQRAGQEAGTTTDEERDDATIRLVITDAATTTDEESEDAVTRAETTNVEIEVEGETTEPRGTSVDGRNTTTAGDGWTQDDTDLSRRVPMPEDATEQMEPPPTYESIARQVFTSDHASQSTLRAGFEAQRATASSSRSIGTQTDPTLSATAAAEALNTNSTEATATTPTKRADLPPLSTVAQVVGFFILIVFILLTHLAAFMLVKPVLNPTHPQIESAFIIFVFLLLIMLTLFVVLVYQSVKLSMANMRRKQGQKRGQYMELAQTEEKETRGIANTEETQNGSDGVVSDHPLLPTNLDEDNRGGDEVEAETNCGVGNDIERNGPTLNQQVPVGHAAESTPSKKEPSESWVVIPQPVAVAIMLYAFVFCIVYPDFLLGATTGNMLGLPKSSKLSTVLGIAYILASKIPMLCF